jgi:hypothetical protein
MVSGIKPRQYYLYILTVLLGIGLVLWLAHRQLVTSISILFTIMLLKQSMFLLLDLDAIIFFSENY